jgi:hypothetical protein
MECWSPEQVHSETEGIPSRVPQGIGRKRMFSCCLAPNCEPPEKRQHTQTEISNSFDVSQNG